MVPLMNRMLSKGSSFFDFILGVFAFLGGVILAFLMFAVCWDVIARSVAGKPLEWVLEFSEYGLLFMCFLSTAWVLKNDRHVISDLLLVALSPRKQAFLNTMTSLAGAIVCIILTWVGAAVSLEKLQIGSYQPTIIQPPDFPLFLIIPVGFSLLSIQFMRRTYRHFGAWKAVRPGDSQR